MSAMSSERLPCKNPECSNTILPATAKANDGLCAPCLGKIQKEEWDEYVRQNRRIVDPYEGITDPVEMICILHTERKHDPLVQYLPSPKTAEEFYEELSMTEAERLAQIAAEAMKAGKQDFAQRIGKSLATLTPLNLDAMLEVWLDAHCLWPAIAFRKAGASIRDRIFGAINKATANINHALSALAWIGDKVVQKQFAEWERNPPAWRKGLHVGPASYAEVGGWELVEGGRRNLFYDECLALVPAKADDAESGVQLLVETQKLCPWCGDALIHLLEIPVDAPDFHFVNYQRAVLPVLTCERCTCFVDHLFAQIDADGQAHWHPANIAPRYPIHEDEWERGPWQGIRGALKPRSAIHAADWCMELSSTQIGGMPCWVQNTAYPLCPDCRQKMRFLAQLGNDFFNGHEGTYYAFSCPSCRTTATAYQQT
jgi:hypothetical protein